MPRKTNRFQENLQILLDELRLANQWGTASILLTVHKSIFSQEKSRLALQKSLEKEGNSVIGIEINKVGDEFVNSMLELRKERNFVFFISSVEQIGEKNDQDTYRILNIHRETFVEHGIRVVFFLTEREAANLPTHAPDFWAFRHRVLEFSSPRAEIPEAPPAGVMRWHRNHTSLTPLEVEENLTTLTNLIHETLIKDETTAIRSDLQYEIGFFEWLAGDLRAATDALRGGLKLAERFNLQEQMNKCDNGLAIIAYALGDVAHAQQVLQSRINRDTKDCILHVNHSIALLAMNKKSEAILQGKKATRLCPRDPWLWNALGFLLFYAGYFDEAAAYFRKAKETSPTTGYFYESLAVCYFALENFDEAHQQMQYAQQYMENRSVQQTFLREYLSNRPEHAMQFLQNAIEKKLISKNEVHRDANMHTVTLIRKLS